MIITGLTSKPLVPIMDSLADFVRKNPLRPGELPLNCLQIEQSGYAHVIRAISSVVLERKHEKRRAVWIHGLANTGKSTILNMLQRIFICDTLEDGVSHFHVSRKELQVQPQIVMMDETNNSFFFKPASIPRMKRFLEGEGIATDSKFGTVGVKFMHCSVFLASNSLPFSEMQNVDSFALRQRIVMCDMNMMSHSLDGKFPFSIEQLADYLFTAHTVPPTSEEVA